MSIKYRMVRWEDQINPEGKKKTGYYPQVVRGLTVDIRQLAERAADGTTLNRIEVEASIRMVIDHIEKELLDSNNVCLDGFGTFSLSAESKKQADSPDSIRAESIQVKRVVFKPSKIFMKQIKSAKFEKAR